MRILSFDSASKTLGYTYVDINEKYISEIQSISIESKIGGIFIIMDNLLRDMEIGVIDTLEGKKLKEVSKKDRIKRMKKSLDMFMTKGIDLVLIEDQPKSIMNRGKVGRFQNTNSSSAQDYISMYFVCKGIDIELVDPSLKNKFRLDITFDETIYKTKYEINKARSISNMEYILRAYDRLYMISKIKKTVLDDAADSFMQMIAYSIFSGILIGGSAV
jgi:hypothetical protein